MLEPKTLLGNHRGFWEFQRCSLQGHSLNLWFPELPTICLVQGPEHPRRTGQVGG